MRALPLLALLLAATAHATESESVRALEAQLERNKTELSLPDAPPIYYLRYHLQSIEQVAVHASRGFLVSGTVSPFRRLAVELRVGEPAFDNTGFGGWENGFILGHLPRDLTGPAISSEAWRVTDLAYKQAVEQFARKQAQFKPPKLYPGDYTLSPPLTSDEGAGQPGDPAALQSMAREVSAAMTGPVQVLRADVNVGHEAGSHWVLDSDGMKVRRRIEETTVRAYVHVRAPDGMLLTDQRLWTVRDPSQLPAADTMARSASAMRDGLLALSSAPVLQEEYVGPVVFEDGAAIDLFRFALLPQLEGTPPEVPFDSFFGDLGSSDTATVRLGRRVLPQGWSVTDDPTRSPEHPSSFAHDQEGTPAQAVQPVADGIVKTVFMSRVPRKGVGQSNGHARGSLSERLNGRSSQTVIRAPGRGSAAKLHKRAIKLAAAYDRSWYLVVRRLQEPVTRSIDTYGPWFGGEESAIQLPLPVALYRVHRDGREELLRGGRFAGVQRWVLRDIAATGPQVEASFMLPHSPGDDLYGATGGMPAWMSAPEVLVGEMELVPTPADPNRRPIVPPPASE